MKGSIMPLSWDRTGKMTTINTVGLIFLGCSFFFFFFLHFTHSYCLHSDFSWQNRTTNHFFLGQELSKPKMYIAVLGLRVTQNFHILWAINLCHFIQEWCELQLFLLQLWDLPSNLPLKWIVFFRDCLLATIIISALIIFTVPSMWFQKLMPVIRMSVCTLSVAFYRALALHPISLPDWCL